MLAVAILADSERLGEKKNNVPFNKTPIVCIYSYIYRYIGSRNARLHNIHPYNQSPLGVT